jgi:hypothetical protein
MDGAAAPILHDSVLYADLSYLGAQLNEGTPALSVPPRGCVSDDFGYSWHPHTGTPLLTIVKGPRGAGKTAWVVRELLMIRRRHVITNIALGEWSRFRVLRLSDNKMVTEHVFTVKPPSNIHYVSSADMTVPHLIQMARELRRKYGKESFVMAVDEGGLKWDSRFRAQTAQRNLWIRFYRVSRHFGFDDVYVIVQVETSLDAQIRNLADVVYDLRNLRVAFPMLFGWIPWPFGISRRRFGGDDGINISGFRWPFYMIFPWTFARYDHRQFRAEFQQDLDDFQRLIAVQAAKEAREAAKDTAA